MSIVVTHDTHTRNILCRNRFSSHDNYGNRIGELFNYRLEEEEVSKITKEERRKIVQKSLGDFPLRIVFSLERNLDTGEFSIQFSKTKKAKMKIENFKLSQLEIISFFRNVVYTPLCVQDIKVFDELDKVLNELSDTWTTNKQSEDK